MGKSRKPSPAKSLKPKKNAKLKSASWYQKTAARLSIKSQGMVASPSIVPETD